MGGSDIAAYQLSFRCAGAGLGIRDWRMEGLRIRIRKIMAVLAW